MSAIVNEVPLELWDLIASYIPVSKRGRLISVSRYFFNIVLHERYGEIRWTVLNEKMLWILHRLQDPFIAERVGKLHIQPWFISYISQRMALYQQTKQTEGIFISFFNTYIGPLISPGPMGAPVQWKKASTRPVALNLAAALTKPQQILAWMINAVSLMTNLYSYSLEWRDLPLNPGTQTFLTCAKKLTRSIRHLKLNACLCNYQLLMEYVGFEQLEELSIHFDYSAVAIKPAGLNSNSTDVDPVQNEATILTSIIVPFINKHSNSLQYLTISSESKTPLTPLFESLITLSALRGLELNIPFHDPILPSTTPLINFLENHSNSLLHVKFNPPTQRISRAAPDRAWDEEFNMKSQAWLNMNNALQSSPSKILSNLETLHLPASAPFETTLMLLRRSSSTLKHLTLSGKYFDQESLDSIFDVFLDRPLYDSLISIRIEITKFTLEFLGRIARRFPGLEILILITKVFPLFTPEHLKHNHDPFNAIYASTVEEILQHVPPQGIELSKQTIPTLTEWGLQDFSLYTERYIPYQTLSYPSAQVEYKLMEKVREYVPSIKRYKGERANMWYLTSFNA